MFLHNKPVFRYIPVIIFIWVIVAKYVNVTQWLYDSATFPTGLKLWLRVVTRLTVSRPTSRFAAVFARLRFHGQEHNMLAAALQVKNA